jgi:molybdopterin-guanine dinucleotide biosynthesis protein A
MTRLAPDMTNGTNATAGVSNIAFGAVILAGGKSSRMGRDKAFLETGGESLLARQIALVREVGAREVFISGRAGVDYSASAFSLLIALAVDMPAMNSSILGKVLASCTMDIGAIPKTKDGIEPLAAVYPKAAWGKLKFELQQRRAPGVRWLAQECVAAGLAQFVDVSDADAECFASANSPETFRRMTNRVAIVGP